MEVYGQGIRRTNQTVDSPFVLGPAGMGVVNTQVLRRPQHELTETRENNRFESLRKSLEYGVTNTVLRIQCQQRPQPSTCLSIN